MSSRAQLAREVSPKASSPGATTHSRDYSSAKNEQIGMATPRMPYSWAGVRTFAEKEHTSTPPAQRALKPGPFPMQAKLVVGALNDPLEREADHFAEQVMGMPEPGVASADRKISAGLGSITGPRGNVAGLQRKCDCGGSCDDCKAEQQRGEHSSVQRKPAAASIPGHSMAPSVVREVLTSAGHPLDANTRAFFEPRLRWDLSSVRLHTDSRAGESANQLDAQAYTVGRDIVFGRGQYAPQSHTGKQLLAHELSHVLQQSNGAMPHSVVQRKGTKVAGCGLLNLGASILDIGGAAHRQVQAHLAVKGVQPEFEIPRATKAEILGFGCRKLGTIFGAADLARRSGLGFDLGEIKPVTMAGRARAKLEVQHYRRRATQSLQRLFKFGSCGNRTPGPDDFGFQILNGLTPASSFSLLSGVLAGDETIGPFWGDPSLTLKAKEVSAGAVCYWCTKDSSTQSKQAKPPGPSVGIGVSIGGSSGGAYNAGVGVAIMSDSTAFGTAGAGVSYKSESKSAGAAGAGASVESDTAGAGAAGAGMTKDTQSVGVGVAGAGKSEGSVSAGAGTAGAGKMEDSATAAAGAAGKGSIKDSAVAGAGVSGSGKLQDVQGAGTTSPGKPVDVKDVQGGKPGTPPKTGATTGTGQQQGQPGATGGSTAAGKSGVPPKTVETAGTAQQQGQPGTTAGPGATGKQGQTGTPGTPGTPTGESKGGGEKGLGDAGAAGGSAGTKDASETAAAKGAQGAKDSGPDSGSSGGPGQSEVKGQSGSGAQKVAGGLGVAPIVGGAASDADRQRAEEDAAKVAALLAKSSKAQVNLFRYVAQSSPDGRFVVPTSQWVDTMMKATEGLTEEQIERLRNMNWTPAKVTPAELRKRIEKALKAAQPATTAADASKGQAGGKDTAKSKTRKHDSGGTGTSASGGPKTREKSTGSKGTKGTKGGPALSGFATARKYSGELGKTDDTGFEIQPSNKFTTKTKKGDIITLEVRWREGDTVHRAMLEYEVMSDPVSYTEGGSKKPMIRFELRSTNTDTITLSPEGVKPPTIVPPRAPAMYIMGKK